MERIKDIDGLKKQFQGKTFGELIFYHRDHSGHQAAKDALYEYIWKLPRAVERSTSQQPAYLQSWIDDMNRNVRSKPFWKQDISEAVPVITKAAETKFKNVGIEPTADDTFNLFQVTVFHFVNATYDSPQTKRFIQRSTGIGSRMWQWLLAGATKLTTAFVMTVICSVWGTIEDYPYLWVPYSGVVASTIDLFSRKWVKSEKLDGLLMGLSIVPKFALSLIGVYAMLIQFACLALGIYWIMIK
jgi:hypothetical protein